MDACLFYFDEADTESELARGIISCARLMKGYGETLRRGCKNYERIEKCLIVPALNKKVPLIDAVPAIEKAVAAALDNPDGVGLGDVLSLDSHSSDSATAHFAE